MQGGWPIPISNGNSYMLIGIFKQSIFITKLLSSTYIDLISYNIWFKIFIMGDFWVPMYNLTFICMITFKLQQLLHKLSSQGPYGSGWSTHGIVEARGKRNINYLLMGTCTVTEWAEIKFIFFLGLSGCGWGRTGRPSSERRSSSSPTNINKHMYEDRSHKKFFFLEGRTLKAPPPNPHPE